MADDKNRPQYENRSRLGLATPAIRPGMKGRVLLAGPSGAGKTYTSLLIAMTLRERTDVASVVMIDTEKDSGRTYADEFLLPDGTPAYKHLSWAAPFNATDLAMTLRDASGKYDAVIIDSHSHFWRGQGGVLDVSGGRWTGWAEARPMHTDMIDAILGCDCHVILCARMTQEHEQERNATTGKVEVRKLGMKIQQDADLEYEVNVALELDMQHILRVTKSRTRAVPVGKEFIAGHAEEFAGQYREWLKGGEPAASKDQVDNLVATLNRIEDAANRMRAKQQFVETFGRPEMLLVSRLGEAAEWVANAVLGHEPDPDRAPDAEPAQESDAEAPAAPSAAAQAAAHASNGPTQQRAAQQRTDGAEPITDQQRAEARERLIAMANSAIAPQTDSVQHEAAVEGPSVFNGDTGHCVGCGGPIWYDADHWAHAEEDDDAVHAGPIASLPADTPMPEVDAIYARAHMPAETGAVDALRAAVDARRAVIEAEVKAMSASKVLQALTKADVSIAGAPKRYRQRWLEYRLSTELTDAS